MNKSAENARIIALNDAVQAAVPWGLTRGQVDDAVAAVRRGANEGDVATAVDPERRNDAATMRPVISAIRAAVGEHDARHGGRRLSPEELADHEVRQLANTIALQAEAISNGTVLGPVHAAAARLASNAKRLAAIVPDDRPFTRTEGV